MYLLIAAILVASVACTHVESKPSIATEPVWHLERDLARVDGEVDSAAASYLEGTLGLSDEQTFALMSVTTGADTLHHVRLQELHRGVPVLGSEIVVHADETTFLGYGGTVTRNLEGFEVEPAIDEERALELALAHATEAMAAPAPTLPARQTRRLAIRPRDGGAVLVWQVEVLVGGQVGIAPGRWFTLIDAGSGVVVESYDGLTTEQASGSGGNPKVERTWSAELDVEADGGEFAMDTARLTTLDLENGKEGGEVVKGPLDSIGDAAINDAHGHAEITLKMMRDWMGYQSIDGKGFPIVSRVHYDEGYDNAFWDGEQMTYGDGDENFYPLSGALDVVAHEIHHGFTEKHSNLRYNDFAGGLNESFSDVAGALAEHYAGDPGGAFLVGEDVVKEGVALRSMCDPRSDGRSIDHALDYDTFTDPHETSGISNKAFCLAVARRVASGESESDAVLTMGRVWYLANAVFWTSETTMSQACLGTMDAARGFGLGAEILTELQQSWADTGVYCDTGLEVACDSDDLCDGGDGETCYSCASDCGSCTEQCSWWKQFKCSAGIGDCTLCLSNVCGDGVCQDDESDETCGQDCGCRAPGDNCDSVAPYGCWCDSECEANGDCCADADVCL